MGVIGSKTLSNLFIYLNFIWIILFVVILVMKKRYLALIVGMVGGILLYILFYSGLRIRVSTSMNILLVSLGYGFSIFSWLWLLLDKDGRDVEWSIISIMGLFIVCYLSYGSAKLGIVSAIEKNLTSLYGWMALMMVVGYLYLSIRNMSGSAQERVDILNLLTMGFIIQFSRELIFLFTNIRRLGVEALMFNSIIKINSILPFIYLLHRFIIRRFDETLIRR